jgi:hypothetical protein
MKLDTSHSVQTGTTQLARRASAALESALLPRGLLPTGASDSSLSSSDSGISAGPGVPEARKRSVGSATPVLVLTRSDTDRSCGVPWQMYVQVRCVFMELVRRHHVVFSIFLAQPEAQVIMTLPQRVLVRCCRV